MPTIQRLRSDDHAGLTAALDADGVAIVEDLLAPEIVDRFNAELDPHLGDDWEPTALVNEAVAGFFGRETRHVVGLAGKSATFVDEVLAHPVLMRAGDHVIGPHCAEIVLNVAHVLDRGPGGKDQLVHRDEEIWPYLPEPRFDVQIASVIALVDFTAANGATRVVPGSHRWERDRRPVDHEIVVAEMPAGAGVVYRGSTLHYGGGNTTPDVRRRGIHVSYCAGWLRTEENQYLVAPLELARTMPQRAQELLGYKAHDAIAIGGGYLGTVELADPMVLMASGKL